MSVEVSSNMNGQKIPYLETAQYVVDRDSRIAEFVLGVFPDASDMDILKVRHLVTGYFHDGIEAGIGLADQQLDATVEAADAYMIGRAHSKREAEAARYDGYFQGLFEAFKIIMNGRES